MYKMSKKKKKKKEKRRERESFHEAWVFEDGLIYMKKIVPDEFYFKEKIVLEMWRSIIRGSYIRGFTVLIKTQIQWQLQIKKVDTTKGKQTLKS